MKDGHDDIANSEWARRIECAYREQRERIVSLLRSRFSPQLIEDALQDIFMDWIARTPASAAMREVMLHPAYLFHSVRRRVMRMLVTEQRRSKLTVRACEQGALDPAQDTAVGSDPLHRSEPKFDDDELSVAFDSLSMAQQGILRSMSFQNIGRHQSSRVFGCTEDCFGVRQHRSLERLRESLAKTTAAQEHIVMTPRESGATT